MIVLNAIDWADIPGKGLIAIVHIAHLVNGPIRTIDQIPFTIGDRVRIDGEEYSIKGIEIATTLVHPTVIKPEMGLAVHKVDVPIGEVPDIPELRAFILRMIAEKRAGGQMDEVDRLLDELNDLKGTQAFLDQVING